MPTYTLDLELLGIFTNDMPGFEIWADGAKLGATYSISSSGTSISTNVTYGGALPSSLQFRFTDASAETPRTIEIHSVKINNRVVNKSNYLSNDSLVKNGSANVDITNSAFIFNDSAEPDVSEFTTGATATFTANIDSFRDFNATTDHVFSLLAGNDYAHTGAGDDKISGGNGNDVIRGGDGNDLLAGDGGNDRLFGMNGDDRLYGGLGDDAIQGGAGADEIHGGQGADRLNGGRDNDTITGGNGDDKVIGGAGDDYLYGDDGDDQIVGGAGDDTIDGGADNDLIYGGLGADNIDGGNGDDLILGNQGNDIVHGGAGDDLIYGMDDDDTLRGGDGEDNLFGGMGNDELRGGNGADALNGNLGADVIYGDDGDDNLFGDNGVVKFQNGFLVVEAENYTSSEDGESGGVTHEWSRITDATASGGYVVTVDNNGGNNFWGVSSAAQVENEAPQLNYRVNFETTGTYYVWARGFGANGGDDSLHIGFDGARQTESGGLTGFTGGGYRWGRNSTYGGQGRVTLEVTTAGDHTLNLWPREDGIVVDKLLITDDAGYVPTGLGPAENTRQSTDGGIDILTGGAGDDILHGDFGNDILNGGNDDDTLHGGQNNDVLNGDAGNDILFGGDGQDTLDGGNGDDVLYGDLTANSTEDGLLAYYKMDNISGTSIMDFSGNGHNATYNGGTVTWAPTGGQINGAIDLSNTVGQPSIDAGTFDPAGTGLTLMAWINQDTITNDARIISKTNGSSVNAHDWAMIINNNASGGQDWLQLRLKTATGNTISNQLEGVDFTNYLDTWTHVAITYDDTTDLITYYINGVQMGTDTHANGGAVVAGSGKNVSIGNQPFGGYGGRKFDGFIDETRIYERGLSAAEIQDIYTDLSDDSADSLSGGDGLDTLYGGGGADNFIFESASAFNDVDVIGDFSLSEGDALDISDIISGFSGTITDYVSFVDSGGNTLVQVDANGLTGGSSFTTIAQIDGLTGLDEATLYADGQIIV